MTPSTEIEMKPIEILLKCLVATLSFLFHSSWLAIEISEPRT